jgi:magnesium transporter
MPRLTLSKTPLRVVIGAAPLLSLLSTARGTAFVFVEVGFVCVFAAGMMSAGIGDAAPWFLLAAVLVGVALRAVDIESAALFIPGGLYGAAKQALGRRTSKVAAAILIVEHMLFGALAAAAAGRALGAIGAPLRLAVPSLPTTALDDLSTATAVIVIGAVALWLRQGELLPQAAVIRTVGTFVSTAALLVAWAAMVAIWRRDASPLVASVHALRGLSVPGGLSAMGGCLFAMGTFEALSRAAGDFPQPKIANLRRTARQVNAFALFVVAGSGVLFAVLVPSAVRESWRDVPLSALAWFAGAPRPLGLLIGVSVAVVSVAFLAVAVHRSATNAQQLLLRLSEDGLVPNALRTLHPRFGTPSRFIHLGAIAQLTILLLGAGQLWWLARAYAIALAAGAIVKIAALVRLRTLRPEPRAFRVGFNVRLAGHERPLGLIVLALAIAVPAIALIASGDVAAVIGAGMVIAFTVMLSAVEGVAREPAPSVDQPAQPFDLLPAPAMGLAHVDVRPGSLLVSVRRPGALAHLGTALQHAGDRDVVVMTVRVVGVDASDDVAMRAETTDQERRLLNEAAMLAERTGHVIRLLIVPAVNVFDAIAETVVRLRSSEVYVGESETLSADEQARFLGEAWERIPEAHPLQVRLVIRHSSGRTAVYHLGVHAPALSGDDLQLIHSLWLDVVKSIGPHVHHHDVVRAALTHMQEQLNEEGPARDAAVDLVRRIARPADELAAVVRQRDFARLRDMVRNRPPADLAAVLTDLAIEDQVVTFRVLPRKVAAATFEYLSYEDQKNLLRAMAQEDVAAILNNMAPDDRTQFLEELPASATQQLLTLLTPEERAVAVTLLGYPEDSIGRLMTPDYIAVREQWTVQEVLDYVRTHGQDSETLNVIYVVDDHGVLVDDIRIREFLLTSPAAKVTDLMDRRFVALSAADDQQTAVAVFRRDDRSALPITDSTGVLIGIVTIDDVLHVAEAAATKEIQRIGGSEALDEPYMEIGFAKMIQKRAGWLTALFLGEMLTATAMGAFEREIERAVVLALFVPLIISSGGNSGSQASTLVIRAIALGEVQLRDWWLVMRREIGAGLALGGILGAIGFLRITIWSAFSSLYGPHWLLVATTVGLALIGVVLWGTLIGSLLPFLLRRLGFDPATSSAPFVATLVDVTGLVIYFSVGIVILRGSLL